MNSKSNKTLIHSLSPLLCNAAMLIIIFWGLSRAQAFLIPILLAVFLAFLLSPFVRFIERAYLPRSLAIFICIILLLVPFWAMGYALLHESKKLEQDLPFLVHTLNNILYQITQSNLGKKLILAKYLNIEAIASKFLSEAGQWLDVLFLSFSTLVNATSQIALVLIYTILILHSQKNLTYTTQRFLKKMENVHTSEVTNEIANLIERYLLTRFILLLFVAAADIFILKLFHISYSLILGLILGILTLLPAIGFFLGLLPCVFIALATSHSWIEILGLVSALSTIALIEGNMLTPVLVGRQLNLNALTIFIGFFAGGLLWGIWGLILSVPILGVLRIVLNIFPETKTWSDLLAGKIDKTKSILQPTHKKAA